METTRPHEAREVVRVTPESGRATRVAAVDLGRTWRRLMIGGLLGITLLAVSAVLVAGPMRSGWSSAAIDSHNVDPGPRPVGTPMVVCLGTADVRGGVVTLLPTASGRVLAVTVEDNAEVQAGQVLVQMDARLAQTQLREAEAGLEAAEAQRAEARRGPISIACC